MVVLVSGLCACLRFCNTDSLKTCMGTQNLHAEAKIEILLGMGGWADIREIKSNSAKLG